MKRYFKSLIVFWGLLAITYWANAQSIVSTRIVALKYENQRDTLRIPLVSDQYPALKAALSDKILFDRDNLSDVIKKYESCGCGVTGLNYEVTFQGNDIISIILYFETAGAYPDDFEEFRTYRISTGELYPIGSELNQKGLNWVFTNYKNLLRKRILDNKDDENLDIYNELKLSTDSLSKNELFGKYVFAKTGIIFTTEKILPHANRNQEPDHGWLIPYDKLKSYKTAGALVLK